MLKFVVLLSFVACAFGAALPEGMLPQLDGRIVGGTPTTIISHPYQISLQRSGSHVCGGSIYSSRVIVTAAHCLQGDVSTSILRIRAGSSYWRFGGVIVPVKSYVNHPNFNSTTMVNDIAVVHLRFTLFYNIFIRNIDLAFSTPANGTSAVVTGWGTLSSGGSIPTQLQKVDVEIVGPSECASGSYGYGSQIKDAMICAADDGKDACQGDSGGPLVSGGVLVGVVSWGIGCAQASYPGVYANVAELRSWVVSNA